MDNLHSADFVHEGEVCFSVELDRAFVIDIVHDFKIKEEKKKVQHMP